jgi:predicted outer membrane repeat protein
MKKIQIQAILFIFGTLILSGCSNVFLDKFRIPETAPQDIPEGFGIVQVSLTRGAARTVIPDPVEVNILHLEYWFAKDGGTAEEKDPDGDGKFVLEAGNYTLEVKGFLDEEDPDSLAARGDTDAPFTISAGTDPEMVNVTLRPVVTGTGTGSLEFGLQYPEGVTVESLTLTRIAGDEFFDLLDPMPTPSGANPLTLEGTKDDIPVGYYLLRAVLKNSAGASAGKTEAVHIYQNLTAKTDLAGYTFTGDDFKAYLVTNTNNSGPGSLRQALDKAPAGQTIRVMLEPGSVIELESRLSISKGLTLEGNGVTLTRAASWTTVDPETQLLRINSAAEVKISGVHFKNGLALIAGGAIWNYGTLTLESCIFSGNRTTLPLASPDGGAIYSSNTLTIRGCTFYKNTAATTGGAVNFDAPGKTLTLTGNLFYGNTAIMGWFVVHIDHGTVNASYNVVDLALGTESGWTPGTEDKQVTALPISPKTFKPLSGSGASNVIGTLPTGYPGLDFYGNPISNGAAAGAVQGSTASGYYLELSVNNSLAGDAAVSGPDEDGLTSGPITLTASPNPGYDFSYWLVNGVQTTSAPASISGHTWVQAVFNRPVTVDVFTDGTNSATTPGTLRYALTNAQNGDIINFNGVNAGTTTIELESALPPVKNITINGNGVTLTPASSWTTYPSTGGLLCISGAAEEAKISRVHFKNGRAAQGGAIMNGGILTLESCIFSGNQGTGGGGAIHTQNTLTIRGCTFYGNTANRGGAVDTLYWLAPGLPEYILTLTGNLFYGNTAFSYDPVVSGIPDSASYNVVDLELGTGDNQSGWEPATGDTQVTALPISPKTFRLLSGSGALGVIDTLPPDYPTLDFYGNPISNAAGAVQELVENGSGYYLELSVNNSLAGDATVSGLDEDGLVSGSITLTKTQKPGYTFGYWLVNGGQTAIAPTSISDHTWVQAVFNRQVTVNVFTDGTGSGTLRYALSNAQNGDIINFNGVSAGTTTIELESARPLVTKSITINGNGVTLTPASSWTTYPSDGGLLYINSSAGEVKISGVHFKDGRASSTGGAISNDGILTLESCIFSGNYATSMGGAIFSMNTLSILGCTFYDNSSSDGGAVCFSTNKSLILRGNLFYGNDASSSYPVLLRVPSSISASYNVVDVALGTGSSKCGWTSPTDHNISSGDPINPATFKPKPGSPGIDDIGIVPAGLSGFPTTDFYGTTRTFPNGAAGAAK